MFVLLFFIVRSVVIAESKAAETGDGNLENEFHGRAVTSQKPGINTLYLEPSRFKSQNDGRYLNARPRAWDAIFAQQMFADGSQQWQSRG